ncbi:MAG TPA: diaminopimelate decarboxylase [Actinomycetota bacterium]|nr:diaminopimelate decarboxylase [Actinomycetota bacterium]
MRVTTIEERTWWARPGLGIADGRLTIAGRDAEHLAREHGTPLFVYDLENAREQAEALRAAFDASGVAGRVRYALKAQREPGFLRFLRERAPYVGIDVCSPGELEWALEHGWEPEEISYTGTNLSDRDLARILPTGCHLNVDLLTQLERVGRAAPGRTIGVRVNPRAGATHAGGTESAYAGSKPTKFGIYPERLAEAVDISRRHGLTIDTVHVHSGYLYFDDSLDVVDEVMRRVAEATAALIEAGCPIAEVNTGGGLGVPFRPTDDPLDLAAWAGIMARHFGPLGVTVATEPGEFIAKQAGVHLAEVVTVEDREGTTFVGLDTGWNVLCEHFVYRIPFFPILCRAADAASVHDVTFSGHINEGPDLFAEDHAFPDVREGDIVALPNVGSYNASMTSAHCMREPAPSLLFEDRM